MIEHTPSKLYITCFTVSPLHAVFRLPFYVLLPLLPMYRKCPGKRDRSIVPPIRS